MNKNNKLIFKAKYKILIIFKILFKFLKNNKIK